MQDFEVKLGHHVLKSFDGVQDFDALGVGVVPHLEGSGHSSGYPPPVKKNAFYNFCNFY